MNTTNKKKKTSQQTTTALRKRCVKMAKDISKHLDGYRCCYCGVGRPQRQVHSHHIFHEGTYISMSADPDNLITLCAHHHQGGMWGKSNDGFNFHNCPRESTEWLMEKFPERYAALKKRSQLNQHINWENKLGELKSIYGELINWPVDNSIWQDTIYLLEL